jgi:hypothetical protein
MGIPYFLMLLSTPVSLSVPNTRKWIWTFGCADWRVLRTPVLPVLPVNGVTEMILTLSGLTPV